MAVVIITKSLEKEVNRRLKQDAVEAFKLMLELESNPKKGKTVGSVGNVTIKEIKFRKFRFYFVTDRFRIKFLSTDELKDIFIKFVRMSEKKDQEMVIHDIKRVLRSLGDEGF
jgi:hypothetical protein